MDKPILSTRIDDENERHTVLVVFNRGAHCGTLTVLTEDAEEIVKRLSGDAGEWVRPAGGAKYEVGDEQVD